MAWSVFTQRRAAQEALLLRTGYVPLLLSLGTALEMQNLVSAQLNHITDAKNPADVRGWIETQRRIRPLAFAGVRAAVDRGLHSRNNVRAQQLGEDIVVEVSAIESYLATDGDRWQALFSALQRGSMDTAEEERGKLLEVEVEGAKRIRELGRRVERAMDDLSQEADARERRAIELLTLLVSLSLAVGIGTAFYASRVLAPLGRVTERARVVAAGDLTPHEVEASNDEIGELAHTFEAMVGAIGQARSNLVAAERMAAVGRMAAHVTHEIRNPISALGLNVELLEEELLMMSEEATEARQLLRAIRGEVDRLAGLSEQYLSLARRPTRQLEPSDLGGLVQGLLAFLRPELEKARVQSRVEVEAGLPEVDLDEAQFRQALLNLVRNAREAMVTGGELWVHVERAEGGVEILVEDTGPGIPVEVQASIFAPFFTTKKQGTGLGLAVTREIIDAHGGRIGCEAREDRGTRFRIWLPASEESLI